MQTVVLSDNICDYCFNKKNDPYWCKVCNDHDNFKGSELIKQETIIEPKAPCSRCYGDMEKNSYGVWCCPNIMCQNVKEWEKKGG